MENVQPNPNQVKYAQVSEDLIETLVKEVTDTSTLEIFNDPVILEPCLHRMEKVSANAWLGVKMMYGGWSLHDTCPECRQNVREIRDDFITKKLSDQIKQLSALNLVDAQPIQAPVQVINNDVQNNGPVVNPFRVNFFNLVHPKTRSTIGARAAMLIGRSWHDATAKTNIAHVKLSPEKGLSLNFQNENDAQTLFNGLETLGFASASFQKVEYHSAQFGLFQGNVSISDPNEIVRFLMDTCQLDEQTVQKAVQKSVNNTAFGEMILRAAKNGFYSGVMLNSITSSPIKASEGANFAIASAAAVLCEGGLSTAEAKNRQDIPTVRIQNDTLIISFGGTKEKYARTLGGALSKAGYKSATFANDQLRKAVKLTDAKEIAHFIKKTCHVKTLNDVDAFIRANNLNTQNGFGKQIHDHYIAL